MQRRLRNVLEHDARAEFSFPSPSSLVKLPNVLIQKFCYHGNVTSHFFSLFPFCCKVPVVAVLCKLNRRVFIVDSFSVKITGVTTPPPPSPLRRTQSGPALTIHLRESWLYIRLCKHTYVKSQYPHIKLLFLQNKITGIIHHNQLLLTKFGRILPYEDDLKSAARLQIIEPSLSCFRSE